MTTGTLLLVYVLQTVHALGAVNKELVVIAQAKSSVNAAVTFTLFPLALRLVNVTV